MTPGSAVRYVTDCAMQSVSLLFSQSVLSKSILEHRPAKYKLAFAYSKDSNQFAYLHSLIRVSKFQPKETLDLSGLLGAGKLFFLFLKQNICCGYSKEPSQ